MKIAIYLDTEGSHGGVHQYALTLLNALKGIRNDEFNIIAICANDEWKNYCEMKKINYYYTSEIISKKNVFSFIISFVAAIVTQKDILEVKKNEIDYVIFPSVSPNSIMVDKPICAIHDLMHRYAHGFPEMTSIYQYILRDILFRIIAKKSLIVFTDSTVGRQHVLDSYLDSKDDPRIEILPFIAPSYVYEYKNEMTLCDSNEWLDLKKKIPSKYFFYPAQFWKHKNHIHLLKALSIAKQIYNDIHIVFVGSEKNGYEEIVQYIEENNLEGNVSILGYVSDYNMVCLYKNARALFMASYCGPTNIPQLEAFHLGCPVAVADVYAVKEQVKDAALLFAPDDTRQIADYMIHLWQSDEECEELKHKGLEMSNSWGPKQFAQRVEEILSKHILEK